MEKKYNNFNIKCSRNFSSKIKYRPPGLFVSTLSSTNKNRTIGLIENRELTEMIKTSKITLMCTT